LYDDEHDSSKNSWKYSSLLPLSIISPVLESSWIYLRKVQTWSDWIESDWIGSRRICCYRSIEIWMNLLKSSSSWWISTIFELTKECFVESINERNNHQYESWNF
jgi:hypothetical protein